MSLSISIGKIKIAKNYDYEKSGLDLVVYEYVNFSDFPESLWSKDSINIHISGVVRAQEGGTSYPFEYTGDVPNIDGKLFESPVFIVEHFADYAMLDIKHNGTNNTGIRLSSD